MRSALLTAGLLAGMLAGCDALRVAPGAPTAPPRAATPKPPAAAATPTARPSTGTPSPAAGPTAPAASPGSPATGTPTAAPPAAASADLLSLPLTPESVCTNGMPGRCRAWLASAMIAAPALTILVGGEADPKASFGFQDDAEAGAPPALRFVVGVRLDGSPAPKLAVVVRPAGDFDAEREAPAAGWVDAAALAEPLRLGDVAWCRLEQAGAITYGKIQPKAVRTLPTAKPLGNGGTALEVRAAWNATGGRGVPQ